MTFLETIIRETDLLSKQDTSGILYLFPNKRACVHFSHALAKLQQKPIWAPAIQSLSEFLQNRTQRQPGTPLLLAHVLYGEYRQLVTSDETFDGFYPWGTMLLRDFDEADRYLLPMDRLLTAIKDIKDIEQAFQPDLTDYEAFAAFWSTFSSDPLPGMQQKFMHIWEQLRPLYYSFQERLAERGLMYEGALYRELAEDTGWVAQLPYEKVYLCGFNALSPAEIRIFTALTESGKGDILWDADTWYVDNPQHEAGHFLRQHFSKHFSRPQSPWLHQSLTDESKEIKVVSAPLHTGQAQVAASILEEWAVASDFQPERTAVVLADESGLFPLLSALPSTIPHLNVTMGYPVRHSFAFDFLLQIMQLHTQGIAGTHSMKYRHTQVMALLRHPFTVYLAKEAALSLGKRIEEEKKLYPTAAFLVEGQEGLLRLMFQQPGGANDLLMSMTTITLLLHDELESATDHLSLESDFLLALHLQLQQLSDLILEENMAIDLPALQRLMQHVLSGMVLPFEGEPILGLQVMGMLETRALDFDRLLILSVNEGSLPIGSRHHSFLPYQVRKGFGLPTFEQQDGIMAYHFYRLLQRAKQVALVYNNVPGSLSDGEPSRYLLQLDMETPPAVHLLKENRPIPAQFSEERTISIAKDTFVQEQLSQFLTSAASDKNYLSPSTITSYLTCPLQFYLSRLARLREPDEMDEQVDAAKMGVIFHEAMEAVYKPYTQQPFTRELSQQLSNSWKAALLMKYQEKHNRELIEPEGELLLHYTFLERAGFQIIAKDAVTENLVIEDLESTDFATTLPVSWQGRQAHVRINGSFDRLDRVNGIARIVDYKSGSMLDIKPDKNSQPKDLAGKPAGKGQIQGLIYALMYLDNRKNEDGVRVGFYHLKELQALKELSNTEPLTRDDLQPFQAFLQSVVDEIFNTEVPFGQTTDRKTCEYCTFRELCRR